jgi:tetratricopeptide (TPR) repeat protein
LLKLLKYLVLLLTFFGAVSVLFSCKSKRVVNRNEADQAKKEISKSEEVKFTSLFIDGCAALQPTKQNLQEALRLFNECKKIDPNSIPLKYELAKTYKMLGQYQLAIQNAKACAYANPKNEWYQLLLIDCFVSAKQYNESVKLREQLVKNFPQKTEFKEDLAIEYSVIGEFEKSYKIYNELETAYGINEQITLNKVKLLKNQRRIKEVENELLKLSESNKNEPRFYAYLAEFYLEQNKLVLAKNMYDKILSIDPNNPSINLALHDFYNSQGKLEEAYSCLLKAFNNPDLESEYKIDALRYYYFMAEKTPESLYYSRGIELCDALIKIHPKDAKGNAVYADFLMLGGKTKDAAKYYYYAAINENLNFSVWKQLLFSDNDLRQYDSLEHHSIKAIELFPGQAIPYFFNGIANIQLKNYKKATLALKDGVEFVVDNNSLKIDFYANLGDAYNYCKDYEKSDWAFDEVLKIDPDNTYALNNYAYYLSLRKENLEKAEKLAKKTNELSPNNRNYMDTYAWVLFQQKKYIDAEYLLETATKMGPPKADILEHYGDVLFKLNKVDAAVDQWNKAKQAGGNSDELLLKIKTKKLND